MFLIIFNFLLAIIFLKVFPGGSVIKNPPAMQVTWVQFLEWEYPLEKEITPHSCILPGKSHGQRSLMGYGPRSCKIRHNLGTKPSPPQSS